MIAVTAMLSCGCTRDVNDPAWGGEDDCVGLDWIILACIIMTFVSTTYVVEDDCFCVFTFRLYDVLGLERRTKVGFFCCLNKRHKLSMRPSRLDTSIN